MSKFKEVKITNPSSSNDLSSLPADGQGTGGWVLKNRTAILTKPSGMNSAKWEKCCIKLTQALSLFGVKCRRIKLDDTEDNE